MRLDQIVTISCTTPNFLTIKDHETSDQILQEILHNKLNDFSPKLFATTKITHNCIRLTAWLPDSLFFCSHSLSES